MSRNRKDEHINIARALKKQSNFFDKIVFEATDLPDLSIDDIDLSTTFLGYAVDYPIYINAMTGGSDKAYEINEFLGRIAAHFNFPMVTGSQSIMFKDPEAIPSFTVIRKHHNGVLVSNINPNMTMEQAKQSVETIGANALSIHLNVIQELVMTEGDRDFTKWSKNIKEIVQNINVPVIVKQVGNGLTGKTITKLKSLGVKNIDVSGSGGTSFIDIESIRSGKNNDHLKDFSIDTAQVLISLKDEKDLNKYASGGIRNPMDVIKALALGASAVGLSRWFLDLTDLTFEAAVLSVEDFLLDLKKIMLIIGVSNIPALQKETYKII